jgi:hypothetical protein
VDPAPAGTPTTWNGFGRDAQHTGLSTVASQSLEGIRWSTPVDLNPQFSGSDLLIHYGTPMATLGGSVVFPVKTGATDGFEMQARRITDGSLIWNQTTDYILPNHNWTPSFGATLTPSGRLYFAGVDGKVYYRDNVDSPSGATGSYVFYTGPLDSTVFIDTPLTSDSQGNIYFGFRVQGTSPTFGTQGGLARLDAVTHLGSYVLASTAAGDGAVSWVTHNDAPAVSNDGSTVYFTVKSSSTSYYGYLVGVDSTTLAPKYKVFLHDPRNSNANNARLLDDGTASPTIAPDGTVLIGVLGNPSNGSRGWLLHFTGNLATELTPGAFGWDYTAAIVPASVVPSYTGTSTYLIFSKYNNYAGTCCDLGDGTNKIAILDPNATEIEPHASSNGLLVMNEVMTKLGPTPDPSFTSTFPQAVREWCINTAAVDPFTDSVLTPSEDGHIYRWDLRTNTLSQSVALTGGIGEAYVPTIIAPDGTVFTLNGGVLFAVGCMHTATGTVTFLDGTTTLGTAPVVNGNAGLTTSSLSVGLHTITVVYSGDANHTGSTSAAITQTVNSAASSTTVTSSVNPSLFGQAVTFAATVSPVAPATGTPTGTVTFLDGAATLGTATLSSGSASFATSSLSVGNHTITVTYGGDSNFGASTSTALTQTVNQGATTTTMTSSVNPSLFGQAVTFTATVTAAGPAAGTASGTVTFLDGAATLGTASLSGGSATLTTSSLSVGTHVITVSYAGDANFNSSTSAAITQTVNKGNCTTTVTSSQNPSLFGQAETFMATVSAVSPAAGTATGTVTFLDGGTSIGSATLSGGTATFTTSSPSVGTHVITASYAGDSNFNSSISTVLTQTVNKGNSSTTVISSPNFSSLGQTVTFTATVSAVSPAAGTPTATVTFLDGGTSIGSSTLSGGTATFTTSSLSLGNHTITVTYAGDNNFNASTSAAITQTVNHGASTTTVTSSPNASQFGQAVTFTATVSAVAPATGTPTGTVTFLDGGTSIGSGTLSGGTATFTTSTLSMGNHTVTVSYAGDSNFNSSTSTAITQTVNKGNSTTTVTSSLNPTIFGQAVTFTATVSAVAPASGTPTGTVTFLDGGTSIGSGTLSGGAATFTTSSLSAGTNVITVSYAGDANFNSSTSVAITQTVSKGNSTTTVTSSVNPSAFGQTVTFTATVSASAPAAGTPTGVITFLDGAATLGTASLSGGSANFTTSSLSLGTHMITVSYAGDANFNSSTSAAITQTVSKANSTTTVTSSVNPAAFGSPVTFTATVAAAAPASGTPTDTVTFLDGSATLGTASLSGGGATFTTSSLAIGNHTITVSYAGDSNFNSSTSAAITQTISRASTTTTVTSSVNPAVLGQSVTFTATVSPVAPATGTPTGTVTFLDGATTLGTATLSGGGATLTTSALSSGNHTITVFYAGDSNFNSSTSAALTQTVTRASSSMTLTSSPNPSTVFQSVTFTVTVSAVAPGSGTPTGTVIFLDGGLTLATATLVSGIATYTTSNLSVGNHTVTAIYAGDTNFSGSSSAALTQTVNKASSSTTVVSSLNPSSFGQAVTFTATVSAVAPGRGTPSGTVTFLDGTATLGSFTLNGGQSTLTVSALSVGIHSITVRYSGDTTFAPSTSAVLSQTVNQATTSTTVTSSLNPSVFGQTVTFTATVTVTGGAGTPTGTVTFLDGAATLGSSTLNGGGVATMTTNTLATGIHSITANYAGTGNFNTSGSAVITQTVNQAATTTTLTTSLNPAIFGQTVTFTAIVSVVAPGAGTQTGSVAFVDGTTTLATSTINANGHATFTASNLSGGIHTITATYVGDANFNGSTSSAVLETVNAEATTTTLTSSVNPSGVNQSVTFTATVAVVPPGVGTPSGSVTFKDGSATLGTVSLNASGQATFTTSTLSAGTHPISVVYAGSNNFSTSASATLTQTVNLFNATTTLASSVNPSQINQSVTFTATVTGSSVTPTGTVSFVEGVATLATSTLSGTGQATFTTSSLSLGTHPIKAVYSGDSVYMSSTSAVLSQTVTLTLTSTTISSSLNPSNFSQAVTFTATVTASSGATPTGTVSLFDGTTQMGTGTLNAAGTTTFTTSGLHGGIHSITAVYNGTANLGSSTSPVLPQTVNDISSTTTLTAGPIPAAFGQPINFRVTVTGSAGPFPSSTDTVSFYDGPVSPADLLGTSQMGDPSNPATAGKSGLQVPLPFLSVGSHSITAVFNGGDPGYSPSTSTVVVETVNQATTTTSVTSSLNPSNSTLSVTFTATVTPQFSSQGSASGTPTGTVTFKDGSTTLGTGTLSGGSATFTTSTLSVGTHSITVSYSGDFNFQASTSGALLQTVNSPATTTTLTSSLNPSLFGQSVTFTATVTSSSPGTPTGTVTFLDGGTTTLGTGTLSAGSVTFSTAALAAGTHTIMAAYSGDANFAASTSTALSQTVTGGATSTTVVSSLNPSGLTQAVTFTATVTSAGGTPSGTVTFRDGGTSIGIGVLNGAGQTSFSTSSLSAGTHLITAAYAGNGNFLASTSATLSQTVNKAGTTTTVTDNVHSSVLGQAVTFTAVVAPGVSGAGSPTGTVTFLDGGSSIGSGTLSGGTATFTTTSLGTGAHTITASYGGDSNFTASTSAAITHTVSSFSSTTALTSSLNPSTFGQTITLTATVTGGGPGTPTGTVTFLDGTTTLGSGTLNASAQATLSTSTLPGGTRSLTAVYSGDVTFAGSTSPTLSQTVNPGASTTSLSSSVNPSSAGPAVTFTATVTPVAPAFGTPTGTVTFADGGNSIGTGTLNASGQATFTTSTLAPGTHSITAVYRGDTNVGGSTSAALTQTVSSQTSTTTLTSSVNPSVFGQNVILTATVSFGGGGTPTGTVSFFDGATLLGSGTLAGGTTTLPVSTLRVATHTLTAVYGGDANSSGSTSAALVQTVNKASTSTTLASSANPSDALTPVTFTATVVATSPSSGTPTGTVTFRDGATSIGAGTLNASGNATFTTSTLAVGKHSITAVYSGDTNFNSNTSAALIQFVNSPTLIAQPINTSAKPAATTSNLRAGTQNVTPASVPNAIVVGNFPAVKGTELVAAASPALAKKSRVLENPALLQSAVDQLFASKNGVPEDWFLGGASQTNRRSDGDLLAGVL